MAPPGQWRRIEALPTDVFRQRSPRLASLATQWATERAFLQEQGAEGRLIEQMKNRMAVETGVIEGLYTLDRGVTETLIAEGFSSSLISHADTDRDPQLVVAILRDQRTAIDFVFELVKYQRGLSTSVIKEMHVLLTKHQPTTTAMDQFGNLHEVPLLSGDWKTVPNNPTRPDGAVHLYCPPEQVSSEMDRLLDLYNQYASIGVAPEVLAAWLHHRFTEIHPFQDGNGRVARLLASIVFIKAQWHPLVVLRDDRPAYIDALEDADGGKLQPLIQLFSSWQTRAFVMALGASQAAQKPLETHLEDVLAGLRERLTAQDAPTRTSTLDDVADVVMAVAERACEQIALRITDSLGTALPGLSATATVNTPDKAQAYKGPRIELARSGGYFADFTRGSRWARVMIRPSPSSPTTTLLVASSALGSSLGSLAVVCGLITTDPGTDRAQTTRVCEDYFVATMTDIESDDNKRRLQQQFEEWVTASLVIGLAQWQRDLG
ncbi:Fic family protein [uncultured Friedmanniella sp.]|uniref:Fic family protein n=1 Tax=uncultured Friedmanniella sp. TaxID=335381 RepID=UPI0035CAC521